MDDLGSSILVRVSLIGKTIQRELVKPEIISLISKREFSVFPNSCLTYLFSLLFLSSLRA
jgi:hypothetical protein